MRALIIFLSLISFASAEYTKDIFIVNYGRHTGIVLKVEDINNSAWEIDSIFEEFEYIEVGWGDEDFYTSSDPSVWMTFKALLLPTSSVLHVRALSQYELNRFSENKIIKLTLSEKEFSKLFLFIKNSFAKDGNKLIALSKGLYPESIFYLSSKKYHLFKTCNVWTAEALKSAEVDITPFISITTDSLFSQLLDEPSTKEDE